MMMILNTYSSNTCSTSTRSSTCSLSSTTASTAATLSSGLSDITFSGGCQEWTAQHDFRLRFASKMLDASQKRWSVGQWEWIEEVEELEDFRREVVKQNRRLQRQAERRIQSQAARWNLTSWLGGECGSLLGRAWRMIDPRVVQSQRISTLVDPEVRRCRCIVMLYFRQLHIACWLTYSGPFSTGHGRDS